jgi:hypothetical protein
MKPRCFHAPGFLSALILVIAIFLVSPAQAGEQQYVWERYDTGLNQSLRGIWGASPTSVFVVGGEGTILRCEGQACRPQVSGTFENLYAVWGTSATDVYAAGSHGAIVHYDGGSWRAVASRLASDCEFRAVWGSSAADIYVAGGEGTADSPEAGSAEWIIPSAVILHFDGTHWIRLKLGRPVATVTAMWGSSGRDVYAGIAGGTILHFDGSTWSQFAQVPAQMWEQFDVQAVWGTSADDLYLAGTHVITLPSQGEADTGGSVAASVLLHYDGATWTPEPKGSEEISSAGPVWVNSPHDVYVVGPGATLMHFDGSDWETLRTLPPVPIHRIWVAPTGKVVVIGPLGTILWSGPSS